MVVDAEYLSIYHHVKDGDGGSGGNGTVPSSSVVGRRQLRGRQKGTTLSTTTTELTHNPNMTSLSAERFYHALDDGMVAAVVSSTSYRRSEGREDKDRPIIKRIGVGVAVAVAEAVGERTTATERTTTRTRMMTN